MHYYPAVRHSSCHLLSRMFRKKCYQNTWQIYLTEVEKIINQTIRVNRANDTQAVQ